MTARATSSSTSVRSKATASGLCPRMPRSSSRPSRARRARPRPAYASSRNRRLDRIQGKALLGGPFSCLGPGPPPARRATGVLASLVGGIAQSHQWSRRTKLTVGGVPRVEADLLDLALAELAQDELAQRLPRSLQARNQQPVARAGTGPRDPLEVAGGVGAVFGGLQGEHPHLAPDPVGPDRGEEVAEEPAWRGERCMAAAGQPRGGDEEQILARSRTGQALDPDRDSERVRQWLGNSQRPR